MASSSMPYAYEMSAKPGIKMDSTEKNIKMQDSTVSRLCIREDDTTSLENITTN
jgi:ATP phosphoribosyltransferase regulatory subunit HisZ